MVEQGEGVQLGGGRDQQVDGAGGAVRAAGGQPRLDLRPSLENPLRHGYPDERRVEQFKEFVPVAQGPGGSASPC